MHKNYMVSIAKDFADITDLLQNGIVDGKDVQRAVAR